MGFTKRLHAPIMAGEVTCSVRIWQRPHVKVGGRYRLGPGAVEVTALHEIALADVTPALARRSGFAGVVDLLKIAKHGPGERIFLVEFQYRGAAPAEADPTA
ncbi:MAG TPA: hypothetical protein VKQ54_09965 [Caulobacteraceae bacterium]|nr:hypothetical protein [Caulobacteraceae bacterium]